MNVIFEATVVPQTSHQLVHAYLIWTALFMVVNVVWDAATKITPPFNFHRLPSKITVIMGATSFCSSLLVLGSLLDDQTAVIVGGTPVPLIIAGGVGALLSLSTLCPYDEKAAESARQKQS